jgi:hypothetical protein
VTVELTADGQVKAVAPDAVLAKWVPELRPAKAWLSAIVRPEDPAPEHRCQICQRPARFGTGVRLLQGQEGIWTCREHRS